MLILASERGASDYRARAELFDGNSYYWASVNTETFPGYEQKLIALGKAVHEHGGIWIAPAAPGFDARLVGGHRWWSERAPQRYGAEPVLPRVVTWFPVMTLWLDGLLGLFDRGAVDLDARAPDRSLIWHPSTRLLLEARSSIPVPGTPVTTQFRTTLRTLGCSFPSKTMPRPRELVTFTRSTGLLPPASKSMASLVVCGGPPADMLKPRVVMSWLAWSRRVPCPWRRRQRCE